jgi:hypothetical protein
MLEHIGTSCWDKDGTYWNNGEIYQHGGTWCGRKVNQELDRTRVEHCSTTTLPLWFTLGIIPSLSTFDPPNSVPTLFHHVPPFTCFTFVPPLFHHLSLFLFKSCSMLHLCSTLFHSCSIWIHSAVQSLFHLLLLHASTSPPCFISFHHFHFVEGC